MYPKMNEKDKIEILRDILFDEDHEFEEKISQRIGLLEKTIQEREKLSEKVDPIIAFQIEEFKKNIHSFNPLNLQSGFFLFQKKDTAKEYSL